MDLSYKSADWYKAYERWRTYEEEKQWKDLAKRFAQFYPAFPSENIALRERLELDSSYGLKDALINLKRKVEQL